MTRLNGRVTNQQARKTCLIVAAVLLPLSGWNYHRGRMTVVVVMGGAGALLVLAGLAIPPAARAFHNGWMKLAEILGWVNSRVLLSLLFYGVLTPVKLLMRLVGRDPLRRRAKRSGEQSKIGEAGEPINSESYWIKRRVTRQPKEQFERIF